MPFLAGEKGFSLIEVMVAMVVLAVGILGLISMQTQSINANSSAFSRTGANGVAISVLETLRELPTSDPNLLATHAVMPNTPGGSGGTATMIADPAMRRLTAVSLAALPMLANVYQMAGTDLVERGVGLSAGRYTHQLAWAVVDNVVGGKTASKTIRLYLTWTGAMGGGTFELTAIK